MKILKCTLLKNIFFISEHVPIIYDKCNPSPCGANTECRDGICSCKPNYFGNPYMSCRPECSHSSECAFNLTCINNKCSDPCVNLCGQNALCEVYDHIPMCSCPSNMVGNAFFSCTPLTGKIFTRAFLVPFYFVTYT